MKTGSLRLRTLFATLAVLVGTLGAFATVVTVRYRDGLRQQAHSQLRAGAEAVRLSHGAQLKALTASLALEGIDVQFAGGTVGGHRPVGRGRTKPGAATGGSPVNAGSGHAGARLLTYTEPVRFNGATIPVTLSSSETSVNDAVHRLIATELIGAAAVLVVACVLTWLALRSALSPLRHVAAVAREIAEGDREQRLRPQRLDTELGQMAASLDTMVDSLDEAITHATRSEAAMRRFLADASHELRTPIAALQATTETLLRQQPQRPERDRLEAEIARGSQRLGRLVDDLLNLARLQANEPLRAEPIDLIEVTNNLIAEARNRTSVRFSLSHNGPAIVVGDPDALERALRNVLNNAIRANGETGEISVDIQSAPVHVRVSVADDGPGVPVAERDRIFDGFVRLKGTPGPGTGLGLAIAQVIARQHRGDITCDNTNTGACFTLKLPAANIAEQ